MEKDHPVPEWPGGVGIAPAIGKIEIARTDDRYSHPEESLEKPAKARHDRRRHIAVLMRTLNESLVITELEEYSQSSRVTEKHIASVFKQVWDFGDLPLALLLCQIRFLLGTISVAVGKCR